jgi:hypothetical protein
VDTPLNRVLKLEEVALKNKAALLNLRDAIDIVKLSSHATINKQATNNSQMTQKSNILLFIMPFYS